MARWWKDHVPYDYNTFNKNPDDLNFAVKGTLVLNIKSDIVGGEKVVTYPDICMAQGHTAARNNWWFGGTKGCYHFSDDSGLLQLPDLVLCFGYYEENDVPKMVRTLVDKTEMGESVTSYTFSLLAAEDVSCASWMGRLPDGTRLKDIMMSLLHTTDLMKRVRVDKAFAASVIQMLRSS